MDDIVVLVTGSGSPGIAGTVYSLRKNYDNRRIRLIGTDIKDDVPGKYLCNSFYRISRPESNNYKDELILICEKEHVDVILPQNTAELLTISRLKKEFESVGAKLLVSDPYTIEKANDKAKLLKIADGINVPIPKFFAVSESESLTHYAEILGWPQKSVVVKPPNSNGMRGVRIIDESKNYRELFYSEKPTNLYIKMKSLKEILGEQFPTLLIMEYLPGDEYTIDALNGSKSIVIPRKRKEIKSGITFSGELVKDDKIIEYSQKLMKRLNLHYAFGFQFKMDTQLNPKLLESNPRIQGTMVLSTLAGANIIYSAVKMALGEDIPEFQIDWDMKILRYWGIIGISHQKVMEMI